MYRNQESWSIKTRKIQLPSAISFAQVQACPTPYKDLQPAGSQLVVHALWFMASIENQKHQKQKYKCLFGLQSGYHPVWLICEEVINSIMLCTVESNKAFRTIFSPLQYWNVCAIGGGPNITRMIF